MDNVPTRSSNGGDRVATCLFYLTDNTVNSGTSFMHIYPPTTSPGSPPTRLTVEPKEGDAVVWFNRYNGEIDDRVVHRGGEAEGVKMAAQVWIHEREYKREL